MAMLIEYEQRMAAMKEQLDEPPTTPMPYTGGESI